MVLEVFFVQSFLVFRFDTTIYGDVYCAKL